MSSSRTCIDETYTLYFRRHISSSEDATTTTENIFLIPNNVLMEIDFAILYNNRNENVDIKLLQRFNRYKIPSHRSSSDSTKIITHIFELDTKSNGIYKETDPTKIDLTQDIVYKSSRRNNLSELLPSTFCSSRPVVPPTKCTYITRQHVPLPTDDSDVQIFSDIVYIIPSRYIGNLDSIHLYNYKKYKKEVKELFRRFDKMIADIKKEVESNNGCHFYLPCSEISTGGKHFTPQYVFNLYYNVSVDDIDEGVVSVVPPLLSPFTSMRSSSSSSSSTSSITIVPIPTPPPRRQIPPTTTIVPIPFVKKNLHPPSLSSPKNPSSTTTTTTTTSTSTTSSTFYNIPLSPATIANPNLTLSLHMANIITFMRIHRITLKQVIEGLCDASGFCEHHFVRYCCFISGESCTPRLNKQEHDLQKLQEYQNFRSVCVQLVQRGQLSLLACV